MTQSIAIDVRRRPTSPSAPAAERSRPSRPTVADRRGRRSEISVLRAVAITSVVGYHFLPGVVHGGFVGVDVFFVISGFLITSHLLHERRSTGRIALRAFWARRIVRLLPSALTVVAVVAVLTPVVLPELERDGTAVQQLASLFSVQNWALVFQSVDYLAADAAPTPLEHFWSLSTEEQFYVAWPLLLVGLAAVSRRFGSSRRVIVIAILVLIAASLTFSVFLSTDSPDGAYVNTGTRAWEFLAGAALCFVPACPRRWWLALTAGGALLIGSSILFFTPALVFPGWIAAIPVVGTLLVIAAGSAPRGSLAASLSDRPIVSYLASRSYTIYLWHWPIIVLLPPMLAPVAGSLGGIAPVVIAAVLTAVLAEVTHRLVEVRFHGAGVRS